jgi:sigma-B regulation protein RsbU (phosphoserine phosphatase)
MFRNLMENLSDAVYFKDCESRFLAVNQAMVKLFGASDTSDIIGRTDRDFFTSEHAEQALRDEQEIIRTGIPVLGKEEKETWADRQETWVSSSKLPLRDSTGRIIGTFGISRDITRRKRIEAELQAHLHALEQDLRRAQAIQRSMLPQIPPGHDRLKISFRLSPLETVGGDFLAFHPGMDGSMGLFIGDLSGHGVSAALFMALVRFITDRLSLSHGGNPAGYLRALNNELMDQMPSAFITAQHAQFKEAGEQVRLRIAGAGHPDPIYLPRDEAPRYLPCTSNAAIGVLEDFNAVTHEYLLSPGDRILFYTDGFPEAMTSEGRMLGADGFLKIVSEPHTATGGELLDLIMQGALNHGGGSQSDDMLLTVVEIT